MFVGDKKPKLDDVISDGHLIEIAEDCVTDLQLLGEKMGFKAPRISGIIQSFPGEVNKQNRKLLQLWKKENGHKATYRALRGIAEAAKEGDVVIKVDSLCA